MAKRKRLAPARSEFQPTAEALETKSMFPNRAGAPIADMAGAAAATAALQEVTAELQQARDEGRLIRSLPLEAIDAGHLIRDRVGAGQGPENEDMTALKTSIMARGQQTPIEVIETASGAYGLISGWRRLQALTALAVETKEARFQTVLAIIRQPETAQDAYVAMVEENEIRVGLSYFERARIVTRVVEAGIYPDVKAALRALFGNASRAKRSKIKSFVSVVEKLEPHLRFPAALGERLGLRIAAALEAPQMRARLVAVLEDGAAKDARAEAEVLQAVLGGAGQGRKAPTDKSARPKPIGADIQPVTLIEKPGQLILTGPGVTKDLIARVRKLIAQS